MPRSRPEPLARLSWPQVLAWRLRRQLLAPRRDAGPAEVAAAMCGVQAQVMSAAELAVAARQTRPDRAAVGDALWRDRTLIKTWAMRGTLHLLPTDIAPTFVGAMSTLRPWDRPSWQRYFGVSAAEVDRVVDAIASTLGAQPITREALAAGVRRRVRSAAVRERLTSGWGELLKPAAFRGLICQGPPQGGNVTYVRPDAWVEGWRLPEPVEAGADLARRYLAAHGPATATHLAAFWFRQPPSAVRPWLEPLGDEIVTVEVEGAPMLALAADVPSLPRARGASVVRLLPSFDQYVLAAGRDVEAILPAAHRTEVSRAGGWFSPVVIVDGRVAGVWDLEGDDVRVRRWGHVPAAGLAAEVRRLSRITGRRLRLAD